jgi:UDP:flavonoid glycosyltransferase YjiC (YdhE family)
MIMLKRKDASMSPKRILYISGSLGLGHVSRDLAIARELRRQHGDLDISWLAAPPADEVIRGANENLLPEASALVDENEIAENLADGTHLNLVKYAFGVRGEWSRNVDVVDSVTASGQYDLIVGDETYEVLLAYKKDPSRKKCPFVMIFDFVGFDAMTRNPLEKLGVYFWNKKWSERMDRVPEFVDLSLFVGEEEDIPDKRFGFLLPGRREWARARCEFVGYVFPFDPTKLRERTSIREKLGYDESPLVVCSIGGTAIGKDLLGLCGDAFPIAADKIPGLRMILVCGPRLDPDKINFPDGVEAKGYVPNLYEHLAASDLAVVQGGGTITLELTALRRPFLYFPIEGHSEQEVHVAGRLKRHGAGVRMTLSSTTPESLATTMIDSLGTEMNFPQIPVDGAKVAAEKIVKLL